jgi:hypothetical protein
MMFFFVEECENSLVCEFSRAFFHNIQYCIFLYRKIFLVLTIDKLRTKYMLYESYDAYPTYLLFAPSHTLPVHSHPTSWPTRMPTFQYTLQVANVRTSMST